MSINQTQILTLARAGNPVRAWSLFERGGLASVTDDIKTLTLKGRLLKDRAQLASGEERARLYAEASNAYLAANALKTDSYPLINAATLAELGGDHATAGKLARDVLNLIESNPDEGETAYWRDATRAEALLLLGETGSAETALAAGIAQLPSAWEDHAATLGQFEKIIGMQGSDAGWLDAHRPPCAVHFSGMIGLDPDDRGLAEQIATKIAGLKPGFAFGALAAGADIMLAEALIEARARLFVALPYTIEEFRAASVEPYGRTWGERFDALLERAETVDQMVACDDPEDCDLASAVAYTDLVSMGQCLRQAQLLKTTAHALTIAAPGETPRSHIAAWDATGSPLHRISAPRRGEAASAAHAVTQNLAMLAISGSGFEEVVAQARLGGLQARQAGADALISGEPDKCLAFALENVRAKANFAAGLTINAGSGEPMADHTALLAKAASEGSLFVDRNTAMIASVIDPRIRIEELGELASPTGLVSLWSISTHAA